MKTAPLAPRLKSRIIISGVHYEIIGREPDSTWICLNLHSGKEVTFSPAERAALRDEHEIATLDHLDDPEELRELLEMDWETDVAEAQRQRARFRSAVLTALDERTSHPKQRVLAKYISAAIDAVFAESEFEYARPSAKAVREWDLTWVASGRSVKSQIPNDHRKGNRISSRKYDWIRTLAIEEIHKHIDSGRVVTAAAIDDKVESKVKLIAAERGLPTREGLAHGRSVGVNYVRNLLHELGYLDRVSGTLPDNEARRKAKGISRGPQGKYSLHEVEVDHTPLDIMVIRPDGRIGRPYLTVLIDRYSRYILGFYITFEPPSWYSVAMALRLTVMPKKKYLQAVGYKFHYEWLNYGAPDRLFMDRAAEFRSATLTMAARDMRITLKDLPAARGDLKGKVERITQTIQNEVSRQLPGYTGPVITERDPERAKAKLTEQELERTIAAWIVDKYHQRIHSTTGEKPQDRYVAGLAKMKAEKLPPSNDILGPITDPVHAPLLTEKGISIDNLRYYSDALIKLWFDAGGDHKVVARPDPYDADTVLVRAERGKWIEAYLIGEYAGKHLSRAEVAARRKAKSSVIEDPDVAIARARAELDFQSHIDSFHGTKKRMRDNSKQPTKPAHAIHEAREDREASAMAPTGFDPETPVQSKRIDGRGPYGSRSLSERAIDEAMQNSAGGAADDGANESNRGHATAKAPVPVEELPHHTMASTPVASEPKPKRKARFL